MEQTKCTSLGDTKQQLETNAKNAEPIQQENEETDNSNYEEESSDSDSTSNDETVNK